MTDNYNYKYMVETVNNHNNLKLQLYKWTIPKPKASIILVHGIRSHALFDWASLPGQNYNGSWIERFNEEGYNVFAYDQQGHGLSDGWNKYRCVANCFEDYVIDLKNYARKVYEENITLPLFIAGLSFGGGVACTLALSDLDFIKGYILISPMIRCTNLSNSNLHQILLPIGQILTYIAPSYPIAKIIQNDNFPLLVEKFNKNRFTFKKKLPVRTAIDCVNAMENLLQKSHLITSSIFIAHGSIDPICDPIGSIKLYNLAVCAKNKEIYIVKNGWHDLQHEFCSEDVFNRVNNWIIRVLNDTGK